MYYLLANIEQCNFFQNKLKLTNEQMKFLFSSFADIANKYKLASCKLTIDCYSDENLVLVLHTDNKDFKQLALADKELSDVISINKSLQDRVFGISIRSYN